MFQRFCLAFVLFFTLAAFAPELAEARKVLPDEVNTTRAEFEGMFVTILRLSLAGGFAIGLTLLIPPKTRSAGYTVLMGSLSVMIILILFTDYMPSISAPLKGILGGDAKSVGDLLKVNGG